MSEATDGAAIACERIAWEATERTGILDLGRLGLTLLPEPLFVLKHLRRLNLGSGIGDEDGQWVESSADIAPNEIKLSLARLRELPELEALSLSGCTLASLSGIAGLKTLRALNCSSTQVRDLAPLAGLTALQELYCFNNEVRDLAPLAGLTALQELYCSGTMVRDLAPLARLTALQWLNCSGTQVSDLAPLAGLTALKWLDCSDTKVSTLKPLARLTALQTLVCTCTQVRDLQPLAGFAALQSLGCSGTQVSDLKPLAGLTALQRLDCYQTTVSNLKPLASLTALQTLNCMITEVSDLKPLAGATALQTLWCCHTQVSDLAPLAGLTALKWLDCSGTQVSDLAPLAKLTALQTLDCRITQVSDLKPLAGLTALRSLCCSETQVRDLEALSGLLALQTLDCFWSPVNDLAPLSGLTALRSLRCSGTEVSDLAPLSGLTALQSLDCSITQVRDLAPLAGLPTLQTLECSDTQVSDLAPLAGLTALKRLNCSGCTLTDFPHGLLFRPSLKEVILYDCRLPRMPAAVLSQSQRENCLEALRAHIRDLQAGTVPVADVKLMVLGNGRVGKTQLCRRLRGEAYDESIASTHGIIVRNAPLPASDDGPPARLQIWDFGGQDIYHGTHALFMRTSAIFLLAWTPVLENAEEDEHEGILFRNHPLAYWVHYIRHLGGAGSPILVVQTRCDRPENETVCPVPESDLFQAFPFRQILRFSARTNRGRAALDQALAEAAHWLREREGIAVIGRGRHEVQQRLEAMRDANAAVALEARRYRTITNAQFQALCEEAGGISNREHLLAYLHNAGIVFHRPGLFHDAIILDQAWALEAIYAVFHRGKCYKKILSRHGRFTRSDLEDWVWQDHSIDEQKLFLSMMQSCGICFEHRRLGSDEEGEAEYIAPDLLPGRTELQVDLDQRWDADGPAETAVFEYAMLHPGLMRSVISRIGRQAGLAADYWKGGVYVYETGTKSRGLIEQEMIDDGRGRIRVQTQRGQAAELLKRLMALIEEEQNRAGMTPSVVTPTDRAEAIASGAMRTAEPGQGLMKMEFGQEPSSVFERYVSYAWGDDTPEGKEREAIVERLYEEAKARGIPIGRDKDQICLGERISKFMKRLGQGDRVFIVLSDKYLKSEFCMYELLEVWRNSRQDEEEFLLRIRVYTMPCAKVRNVEDWLMYADYWKKRHDNIKKRIDRLGKKTLEKWLRMKEFSENVTDLLHIMADIRQPRTFEELMKYGFDDLD